MSFGRFDEECFKMKRLVQLLDENIEELCVENLCDCAVSTWVVREYREDGNEESIKGSECDESLITLEYKNVSKEFYLSAEEKTEQVQNLLGKEFRYQTFNFNWNKNSFWGETLTITV